MTRAEAIEILERRTTIPGDGYTFEQINEALDLAIAALRGPTRELVEADGDGRCVVLPCKRDDVCGRFKHTLLSGFTCST